MVQFITHIDDMYIEPVFHLVRVSEEWVAQS